MPETRITIVIDFNDMDPSQAYAELRRVIEPLNLEWESTDDWSHNGEGVPENEISEIRINTCQN